MDHNKLLRELYAQRDKLQQAIASLEELQRESAGRALIRSGRGRKFMAAEERMEVSERMKRYWASRRKSEAPPESAQSR
ncbi:MAG TPA: hypothetical protein VJ732_11615 [Bryobacteraceae bacterium]|nr:hypothetical protein [Bryobacteraceae bacterium]